MRNHDKLTQLFPHSTRVREARAYSRAVRCLLGAMLAVGFVLTLRAAFGQSLVVTATPADINVTGVVVVFQPDGGCTGQPIFTDPTNRPSTVRTLRPATCATALTLATRAATLDVQISDGGLP